MTARSSPPSSGDRGWSEWLEAVPSVASLEVVRPADASVVAACLAAAVGTDLAVRSGVAGLAGAVLVAVVTAALLTTGRLERGQAQLVVGAAPLFGVWLALRASPWLLPLDILAAGGLLVLGASLAGTGSVLDLSVPQALARAGHALAHGLAGPAFALAPWLRRDGGPGAGRAAAVARGLALAIPLVVVLALLLGSADAVFASFLGRWNPVSAVEHGVLLAVGAWGMAGLLRVASARPPEPIPPPPHRLGRVEATVVLASLVALFGAFAVAQLVALSSGGRHVLATAGLTYAEYARSGFFQLLAVAAITLVVLSGLRPLLAHGEPRGRLRLVLLSELAVALTLVIVVVAIRRLALYEQAYGLTMLRLFSVVFAVWTGVVFVLLGASLAGVGARRHWFPPAAVAAGLLALLALNLADPEALVVRRNVAHGLRTDRFDLPYLGGLSDDAVPALVQALPRLDPDDRLQALAVVCQRPPRADRFSGLWAASAARARAERARSRTCVVP